MTPQAPYPVPAGAPWLDDWRRLFGEHRDTPLAQVATVSAAGSPEVRTVVLRGLSTDGCPYFSSDLRSAKVRSIRAGSDVELCVWWSGPGVQLRLRGPAAIIGEAGGEAGREAGGEAGDAWDSVRRELWRSHRLSERRGFAGPAPGSPLAPDQSAPTPPDSPHPDFGILVVTPLRFDRLELGDPHVRELFAWEPAEGWRGGRVAP